MKLATKILATSTSLTATAASSAWAGPPPLYNWMGFYIGANVGVVSTDSTVADYPPGSGPVAYIGGAYAATGSSLMAGAHAGFNWQVSSVVAGVEGDADFGSFTRSRANITALGRDLGADTFNSRLSSLSTIRGRLGWAFDRWLVYGTGGVAFAQWKDQLYDSVFPFVTGPKSNLSGWIAGGGIEFAFTEHWTGKAEFLHAAFPNRVTSVMPAPGLNYAFIFKDSLNIGRVGVSYKF